MAGLPPAIAVVTQPTRLAGLVARWATRSAASFHVRQAIVHERSRRPAAKNRTASAEATSQDVAAAQAAGAAAFAEYEREDQTQHDTVDQLKKELDLGFPLKFVERQYLPTFDFRGCVAVIVAGRDGLVANAREVCGRPAHRGRES